MKDTFYKILNIIGIFTFIFIIPASSQAQSKKAPESTKKDSAKKVLSDEEKKELKAAQEILKVMETYHKGKFTRLFNAGSKDELMALPDLGEKTAERIIAARPHESSAHVVLVRGIGVETYKKWVDARK